MSRSIIIDRRLNSKGKSTVNRERFMRRYRQQIRSAVNDAVNRRSITDTQNGENISISKKNLSEPVFHHDSDGKTEQVLPGNREFVTGDRIRRPKEAGGGSGQGKASDKGQGVDDFVFHINREEFLEYLFDDLALPNMIRKELQDSNEFNTRRAGFISAGSPERLHIIRSLRNAHARRIALSGKERRQIRELKKILEEMEKEPDSPKKEEEMAGIHLKIGELGKKIQRLPFIDDFDLKYANVIKTPSPSSRAVMFCIMDVSGSMTRDIKDMAKRFFFLLYLFLQKNYESVELVFIRHHAEARECNEEDFFYARETGGTVVSSALKLTGEIIGERYQDSSWNIYVAQASDGDNWEADSPRCSELIRDSILSKVQYFAYVEITDRHHQNLWHEYKKLKDEFPDYFNIAHIRQFSDVYPVFRKLFEKREMEVS